MTTLRCSSKEMAATIYGCHRFPLMPFVTLNLIKLVCARTAFLQFLNSRLDPAEDVMFVDVSTAVNGPNNRTMCDSC